MALWWDNGNKIHVAKSEMIKGDAVMERVMNKKEVVEETVKLLGSIELPVCMAKAISTIQGGIRNLNIVLAMLAEEEKAREVSEDGNADAE